MILYIWLHKLKTTYFLQIGDHMFQRSNHKFSANNLMNIESFKLKLFWWTGFFFLALYVETFPLFLYAVIYVFLYSG